MTALTPDDRRVIAAALRWGREQGYYPAWGGRQCGPGDRPTRSVCVRPWSDGTKAGLVVSRPGLPTFELVVTSAREVVDVLCALGVLPIHMSSAYTAGRAAVVESVMTGCVRPMMDDWYGTAKAPVRSATGRAHRNGYLDGVAEAVDAACESIGVEHPLWDDMREVARG